MKHIIWKAYWDFEKEERYLNVMSAKGLALTDYSWCRYVFEEAPRGEWTYRTELLENSVKHPDSQNYIRFMEETGAEFVASYYRWVFFRKKAADGTFNIYSDIDSKIKHYKRIRSLFICLTALNLFAAAVNAAAVVATLSMGGHPYTNLYMGLISFSISALLFFTLVLPMTRKIGALRKDKDIIEY